MRKLDCLNYLGVVIFDPTRQPKLSTCKPLHQFVQMILNIKQKDTQTRCLLLTYALWFVSAIKSILVVTPSGVHPILPVLSQRKLWNTYLFLAGCKFTTSPCCTRWDKIKLRICRRFRLNFFLWKNWINLSPRGILATVYLRWRKKNKTVKAEEQPKPKRQRSLSPETEVNTRTNELIEIHKLRYHRGYIAKCNVTAF